MIAGPCVNIPGDSAMARGTVLHGETNGLIRS
jgi:hypothetical protein